MGKANLTKQKELLNIPVQIFYCKECLGYESKMYHCGCKYKNDQNGNFTKFLCMNCYEEDPNIDCKTCNLEIEDSFIYLEDLKIFCEECNFFTAFFKEKSNSSILDIINTHIYHKGSIILDKDEKCKEMIADDTSKSTLSQSSNEDNLSNDSKAKNAKSKFRKILRDIKNSEKQKDEYIDDLIQIKKRILIDKREIETKSKEIKDKTQNFKNILKKEIYLDDNFSKSIDQYITPIYAKIKLSQLKKINSPIDNVEFGVRFKKIKNLKQTTNSKIEEAPEDNNYELRMSSKGWFKKKYNYFDENIGEYKSKSETKRSVIWDSNSEDLNIIISQKLGFGTKEFCAQSFLFFVKNENFGHIEDKNLIDLNKYKISIFAEFFHSSKCKDLDKLPNWKFMYLHEDLYYENKEIYEEIGKKKRNRTNTTTALN